MGLLHYLIPRPYSDLRIRIHERDVGTWHPEACSGSLMLQHLFIVAAGVRLDSEIVAMPSACFSKWLLVFSC